MGIIFLWEPVCDDHQDAIMKRRIGLTKMVRKASRLAPGQQSVEEVLLNRLANGRNDAAARRSSTALPPSGSTRRSLAMTGPRAAGADTRALLAALSIKSF